MDPITTSRFTATHRRAPPPLCAVRTAISTHRCCPHGHQTTPSHDLRRHQFALLQPSSPEPSPSRENLGGHQVRGQIGRCHATIGEQRDGRPSHVLPLARVAYLCSGSVAAAVAVATSMVGAPLLLSPIFSIANPRERKRV
ncbi:serine/threonine protein kinase [Sesbania bispinosa]|nr:serine/threonine protein kinase [Sesbania bispinosa]